MILERSLPVDMGVEGSQHKATEGGESSDCETRPSDVRTQCPATWDSGC